VWAQSRSRRGGHHLESKIMSSQAEDKVLSQVYMTSVVLIS